jgi:glycolate oxidase iron-sulfur subunit
MKESDWCCGSAGIYNMTHPERAAEILDRKLKNIAATEAEVVLTGNPGCLLQLEAGVKRAGIKVRVLHPTQLLDAAYRNEAAVEGVTPPPAPPRRGEGQTKLA